MVDFDAIHATLAICLLIIALAAVIHRLRRRHKKETPATTGTTFGQLGVERNLYYHESSPETNMSFEAIAHNEYYDKDRNTEA